MPFIFTLLLLCFSAKREVFNVFFFKKVLRKGCSEVQLKTARAMPSIFGFLKSQEAIKKDYDIETASEAQNVTWELTTRAGAGATEQHNDAAHETP